MSTQFPASSPSVTNFTTPGNFSSPTNGTIPTNGSIWDSIPKDNGRSLQVDIIVCSLLTWLVAVAFVVMRFYTRCRLKHILGPTDWCIIPALLCAAGVSVSSIEQAIRGAGRHAWELEITALPALERAAWYGILFYNLSLVFTRVSILLLYKRIFTYNWVKKAIQVSLVLVTAVGIWFVASVCTACVPLQAFWDWSLFWTSQVYCQPPNLWWGNAALHLASDLVIVLLPLPALSKLNLPRKQKLALVLVFGMGFFVCIVSVLRLVTMIDIQAAKSWDATYISAQIVYWSTVEVNASIACACLMTMKPLIQKWFPRLLSGGQYARDRSLRWITPLNTTRDSRQSFARPGTGAGHQRMGSNAGDRKSNHLPRVDEKEMAIMDDGLRSPDLESQRHRSLSTVVCEDDSSAMGLSALRAPPKAHLRLSIHVTKSVHISKFPESPTPKQHRDDDDDTESLGPEYPGRLDVHERGDRSPGCQSEGSTIVVGKDWALENYIGRAR